MHFPPSIFIATRTQLTHPCQQKPSEYERKLKVKENLFVQFLCTNKAEGNCGMEETIAASRYVVVYVVSGWVYSGAVFGGFGMEIATDWVARCK